MVLVASCATRAEPTSPPDDPTVEPDEQTSTITSGLIGIGQPCTTDSSCVTGICNSFTHVCDVREGIGAKCNRGIECANGLCNLFLHQCAMQQGGRRTVLARRRVLQRRVQRRDPPV